MPQPRAILSDRERPLDWSSGVLFGSVGMGVGGFDGFSDVVTAGTTVGMTTA